MWRLGLGIWFKVCPKVSGHVLILTHVGRKTGIKRYQPLNYAIVDKDIYCVAAFGGISDWYRNILVNPNVEVWLPTGWWEGIAVDVSDSPARIKILRQVMIRSGFAAYLAGLNPHKITDEELDAVSKNYRLLRIRRTEARTGSRGPGDLEWVWPLTTIILLGLVLFRRKR